MKKLATVIVSALYALSTTLGLVALVPVRVAAADSKTKTNTTQKAAPASKEVVYKYVAQPGDSYSKIARKAVQTYAKKNKLKFSNAKVIAAETWLTQDAGSPSLNRGQAVEVKENTVKTFVDKAQKLTSAAEARWNVYTVGVNFNTNAVGQSK
jgi:hypothetical protein